MKTQLMSILRHLEGWDPLPHSQYRIAQQVVFLFLIWSIPSGRIGEMHIPMRLLHGSKGSFHNVNPILSLDWVNSFHKPLGSILDEFFLIKIIGVLWCSQCMACILWVSLDHQWKSIPYSLASLLGPRRCWAKTTKRTCGSIASLHTRQR